MSNALFVENALSKERAKSYMIIIYYLGLSTRVKLIHGEKEICFIVVFIPFCLSQGR